MGDVAFEPIFWGLAALALAGAVAYGTYFLHRPHGFVRALVKTLFMGAGAAALINAGAPFPLIAAVVLSAAGDFFLAFDKKWVLPLGILSFLLAQLLYLAAFLGIWFFSGDNAPLWPRYLGMALIGVTLVGFLVWFWRVEAFTRAPVSGAVAVAGLLLLGAALPIYIFATVTFQAPEGERPSLEVGLALIGFAAFVVMMAVWRRSLGAIPLVAMVYAGVITTMALAAMWMPWIGWPAIVGALLFMVSDLVLAGELFRLAPDAPARRWTAPVVWWTYVAAQIGIVSGVLLVAANGGA